MDIIKLFALFVNPMQFVQNLKSEATIQGACNNEAMAQRR